MSLYNVLAALIGLLFGLGLLLSGMVNPAKVLGFLDLAGRWDPSLLLVMGGAISIGLVAFRIARRNRLTLLGAPLRLPERRDIDLRLVLGGLGFGLGWGLAGFCPGPALVAVGTGELKALVFCIAMFAGMGAFELIEDYRRRRPRTAAHADE